MKGFKIVVVIGILAAFYLLIAKDAIEFGYSYRDVNAEKAYKLMEKYPDLQIIDISGVYDKGHIPGAVNYFIGDGTFDQALQNLDKEKRYLVYYHATKTSIEAANKFKQAGFKRIYRLEGNYNSWVRAGFQTSHNLKDFTQNTR